MAEEATEEVLMEASEEVLEEGTHRGLPRYHLRRRRGLSNLQLELLPAIVVLRRGIIGGIAHTQVSFVIPAELLDT